jgi:hypothetical protein
MKHLPNNHIYWIAMFVHHVLGKHEFTGRDLINASLAASDYFNRPLDERIETARAELLEDYGFADEKELHDAWMQHYTPPYDQDNRYDATTCDSLRTDCYRMRWIATPTQNESYLYAIVSTAVKRGQLVLIDTKPVRKYRINKWYVDNPCMPNHLED